MASSLKTSAAVIALLALIAVPAIVCVQLGAQDLASSAVQASLSCLIAAALIPWRHVLILAALIGLASAIAIPAASAPLLAAALMAGCGAGMGVAAKRGTVTGLVMAPITIAFLLSDSPDYASLTVGLALFGSAAFAVVLGYLVSRRIPQRAPQPLSTERAAAYGATLALLAGVSAYFVIARDLGHPGAWLLLTFFVVIQPYLQDGWRKALERAGGTILGFAIAIMFGLLTTSATVVFLAALVAMVVGAWLRIKNKPYWQNTAALTVGVVMSASTATTVVSTAEQRMWATSVGVAVSLLAMALLQPIYKREAARANIDRY